MSVSLLGTAAPGFDRPLEVLEACHGCIARQHDTLLPAQQAGRHSVSFAR